MSPYDHIGSLSPREVRRSLPVGLLIVAALLVLTLLSVLAPPPPAGNLPEAGAAPARTIEDWRGNSARITPLPLD